MSFPLRLTSDLAIAFAAHAAGRPGHPLILRLSSDNFFDSGATSRTASQAGATSEFSFSPDQTFASQFRSPVVWIAGQEPLNHPEVARFTNALAASGRHVFLETTGATLKPRLHEFKPSSRFYFAIRLNGENASFGKMGSRRDVFSAGVEAIRMAHLAGFYTCAHLVLRPGMADRDLEKLHAEIRKLDVDGFVITADVPAPELVKQAARLRRRLLSRRCALLSFLLDSSAIAATSRKSTGEERVPLPKPQGANCGEGAEAS